MEKVKDFTDVLHRSGFSQEVFENIKKMEAHGPLWYPPVDASTSGPEPLFRPDETRAQRFRTKPKPREYIIDELFKVGTVALLVGGGGSRKSYFALNMALTMALPEGLLQ